MDKTAEYQKKRKNKDLFKKIFINSVIGLITITFVLTIGVTWNNRGRDARGNDVRVMEINGRTYFYKPSSAFFYIYNTVRDSMSKRERGKYSEDAFNTQAVSNSLELLENYALMAAIADKNDIRPCRLMVKGMVQQLFGGRGGAVGQGLMDYVNMVYGNLAVSGNNGDLINTFSPITIAEKYTYFDLVNFTVQAELLYLNIGDYLSAKINTAELQPFYESNQAEFLYEVTVDNLVFSNKQPAADLVSNLTNGGDWDKALEQFKGQYVLLKDLVLKETNNVSKRFFLAISNKPGGIIPRPVYENGVYHVVKIKSFPGLGSMDPDVRKAIAEEYYMRNEASLREKFRPELDGIVKKAGDMIKSGADLRAVARSTGMSFVKTGRTSPINQILRDETNARIDVPVMQNDGWFDYFFGADKDKVSPVFTAGNWYVFIKPVYKGNNPSIDFDNVDQEVNMRYINFKNVAITRDWFNNLKDKSKIKYFNGEISNFIRRERNTAE